MTGLALARRIAPCSTHFIIGGESCCYDVRRNVIVLTLAAADGTTRWARVTAAHEAVHALQVMRCPWLLRWPWSWLVLVRLALEIDAWRQAIRFEREERP